MKRAGVVFAAAASLRAIRVSLAQPQTRKRENLMNKMFAALAVLLCVCASGIKAQLITVDNFDDIQIWAGSGINRSALVIDWNNGASNEAMVWGYRWDGPGKVWDMLEAIRRSDPRLFLRIDSETPFGVGLFGIGLQNGPSPFGITGAQDPEGNPVDVSFTEGVNDMNVNPDGFDPPLGSLDVAVVNAGDFYAEGWFDGGFWTLYLTGSNSDRLTSESSFTYPSVWSDGWYGLSGTPLVNESWFALSFHPGFVETTPGTAFAAVPEPSTWALLGGAALAFGIWRIRRATRCV
jgi:hypothetical protein